MMTDYGGSGDTSLALFGKIVASLPDEVRHLCRHRFHVHVSPHAFFLLYYVSASSTRSMVKITG